MSEQEKKSNEMKWNIEWSERQDKLKRKIVSIQSFKLSSEARDALNLRTKSPNLLEHVNVMCIFRFFVFIQIKNYDGDVIV